MFSLSKVLDTAQNENTIYHNIERTFDSFKKLSNLQQEEQFKYLLRLLQEHLIRQNCYGVSLDTKIYRIMEVENFLKCLKQKNFFLSVLESIGKTRGSVGC